MSNYEYEGETFMLDGSKGCYVEVTYKGLKGYFGVNISGTGTDQYPYSYYVGGGGVCRRRRGACNSGWADMG